MATCRICTPEHVTESDARDYLTSHNYEHVSDGELPDLPEDPDLTDGESIDDDDKRIEEDNEEIDEHKREKRFVGKKQRKEVRKRREGKMGKKHDSTRLVMPTGKSFHISNPATPMWKCGNKAKLIYLGPNSKKGQREFNIVEKEMQNTITEHDNCENGGGCFDRYHIVKIEKVLQGCAWRRYQNRKKDVQAEAGYANERMLFHGTDAVWAIVGSGFDERYASTNGQFGAGLYFAQHSSLCNQFVFGYFGGDGCPNHHNKNCYECVRHMLLCRVILGKAHQLDMIQNMPHPPPDYHSVEALTTKGSFKFPEFVVYRGEQAYPEYLITYKIVKPDNGDDDKGSTTGSGYDGRSYSHDARSYSHVVKSSNHDGRSYSDGGQDRQYRRN